ncbi:MAG TPA: hydroxyacid dehydrogenase [Pirellulales bacterium]|jgi:D-3-phosphoglycerate dehydrogenase|nr:hydroxyacid dehydrogenase [Pirellulales bacterium]
MHKVWFERALPAEHAHLLAGLAEVAGPASATPENPLAVVGEADAIVASARIRYDAALMDRAPRLRVIARTGVGYDNVIVPDATARGIAACYTPDAPTIATSEHAMALLLATVKHLKRSNQSMLRGDKSDYLNDFSGMELYQHRLGLVGLGRIGGRVAQMAKALGMFVSAYDPFVTPARGAELGVELVSPLEALLGSCDVVSLHVPLGPQTRHMIDDQRLAQMKPGAYLINAARGGLVDETALLAALESGRLAGAGLDVFDPEPPPPDHSLLSRGDVICTPHVGGATLEGRRRIWEGAIAQVLQVLRGERPPHLLNPEVWEKRRLTAG